MDMNTQEICDSVTPTENTVNFYLNRGCLAALEIDQELFELESEDTYLEYVIR